MVKTTPVHIDTVDDLSKKLTDIGDVISPINHVMWALITERDLALERINDIEEEVEKLRGLLEQLVREVAHDAILAISYGPNHKPRLTAAYKEARSFLDQKNADKQKSAEHSVRLCEGLTNAVNNLRSRPSELRGPFRVPDLNDASKRDTNT